MSDAPLVSVIVPAYDEERWIGAALESLLSQDHPHLDIIMVDDGSRDATAEIAGSLGVRVLATNHRGDGAARAAGAEAASGDVLVFCDADEIYAPDFVSTLVAPLADPSVRATFPGGLEWHNPDQGLAPGWLHVRGVPEGGVQTFRTPHAFARAVRRTDYVRVGGYPAVGYGSDERFGRLVGPAVVVDEARWRFTLPTGPAEVFRKARWIGRGPLFEEDRPPLWRLMPPASWLRAARLAGGGRMRAAAVRVIYDAGLLVGLAERRLRPRVRDFA